MTDPLDALREPVVPIDPDPRFTEALRDRLRRALLEPEGTTMTTATSPAPAQAAENVPLHSLTPYIAVADARRALDFYVGAFGARRRGEPVVMDDGRIGHAELAIGDSVLMLADEFAEIGMIGPAARGGPSQSLVVEVSDVDGAVARAVELGAQLDREPADYPHGRNGVVLDPFGHRWMISSPPPVATGPAHGELGYASLWTADADRAADFYAAVLGWRYAEGSESHPRVEGISQPIGIWGAQRHATVFTCFAVRDVRAAVRQVRASGGQADDPVRQPYGLVVDCTDDQGMRFAVYEHAAAPASHPTAAHGEIAYLTFQTRDSARFRDFFGQLLGWRFSPGHVEDGWQVEGVHPLAGVHGGHELPTVVPMFAVPSIDAAVSAVRTAGGTASDPQRQPYGISSECTDDQGARFYLGELT